MERIHDTYYSMLPSPRLWRRLAAEEAAVGQADPGGILNAAPRPKNLNPIPHFALQLGVYLLPIDSCGVGLLQKKQQSGKQTTLEASLVQRLGPAEKETVRKLQKKAAVCWWQPGHPGWAIWPVDTQQFIQDMVAPVSCLIFP